MKTIPADIKSEVKHFTANFLSKNIAKRKTNQEVSDKLKQKFNYIKNKKMDQYKIRRKVD